MTSERHCILFYITVGVIHFPEERHVFIDWRYLFLLKPFTKLQRFCDVYNLRKKPTFGDATTDFPPNDVWETSTEIPYWWPVTTQISVVISACNWSCRVGNLIQSIRSTQIWVVTRYQCWISGLMFLRRHLEGETSGSVAKFRLGCFPRLWCLLLLLC